MHHPAGLAHPFSPLTAAPWQVVGLPEQTRPHTRFAAVTSDGQRVLKVEAASSCGKLLHPLPAATVCYVRDAHLAPGTVLDQAWTRRIRQIVLRGPEAGLHTWVAEQRDVVADADNTHGHSLGHVGVLTLD